MVAQGCIRPSSILKEPTYTKTLRQRGEQRERNTLSPAAAVVYRTSFLTDWASRSRTAQQRPRIARHPTTHHHHRQWPCGDGQGRDASDPHNNRFGSSDSEPYLIPRGESPRTSSPSRPPFEHGNTHRQQQDQGQLMRQGEETITAPCTGRGILPSRKVAVCRALAPGGRWRYALAAGPHLHVHVHVHSCTWTYTCT